MFTWFNKNKFNYNKGQLAPIFIVVLMILLIMALVTVNLSKVSFIKTDSSNAVDSGALAGGSVMANVFNAQAITNSVLISEYQMFVAEMAGLAAIAIASAWAAADACAAGGCFDSDGDLYCCPSGACAVLASVSVGATIAAQAAYIAFQVAQLLTYADMREKASEGRKQAIKLAYRFAFINSGIGNKLIRGSPPDDSADQRGDDNNYSDNFSDFLEDSAVTSGDYIWTDGQNRQHQVHISVMTEDSGSYKLQYTLLPNLMIIWLLNEAFTYATAVLDIACSFCRCSAGTGYTAAGLLTRGMAFVMVGLAPGIEYDDNIGMDLLFPICWVVDINHDRLLSVTTWQEHGRQDYGLWEAVYPHVESRSVVNFDGNGEIYEPNPRFDASIVEVD